jgi:hypothetical protein
MGKQNPARTELFVLSVSAYIWSSGQARSGHAPTSKAKTGNLKLQKIMKMGSTKY